jgi:hypothetical protein
MENRWSKKKITEPTDWNAYTTDKYWDGLKSIWDHTLGIPKAEAATDSYFMVSGADGVTKYRRTDYNLIERIIGGKPAKEIVPIGKEQAGHPILQRPEIKPVVNTIATSTKDTSVMPEWVAALIFNESSGVMDPTLKGDAGKAIGITQIQDVSWKDDRYQDEFKEKYGREPRRTNLDDQVRMGVIILNQLYHEWEGNLEYVFRAYNSGSESLKQQLGRKKWTADRTEAIKNSTEYWQKIKKALNIK